MLLPIVVFFAVTCGCLGAWMLLAPDRTTQRLNALSDGDAASRTWRATIVSVVSPFAKLSIPSGEWETSPLRLKFMNAGIRHPKAAHFFFGLKTLLPIVFALPTFLVLRATETGLTLVFWVLSAAVLGCYMPNIVVHWLAQRRKREIFENFPDAADLLLVCVEAGLGMDAALTRVAEEMLGKSEALAEELQLTNLEMRAGGTREKALRNLALRTGIEELASFSVMLTQADRFGTSVGDSLRVFSDDLRYKRQNRAEEKAAKVPTKLLFPLVLFIFPSIIMVVLGPAIINIIRTIGPMLTER